MSMEMEEECRSVCVSVYRASQVEEALRRSRPDRDRREALLPGEARRDGRAPAAAAAAAYLEPMRGEDGRSGGGEEGGHGG